jgi:LmbE family N-acetylglucosaminyl deacetylase
MSRLPTQSLVPGPRPVTSDLPTPRRVLAVGAHPDDAELACGGTLAKWAAAGAEVTILVCTDGSKGTWDADEDPAALARRREEEQRAAARALGSSVRTVALGRADGELAAGLEERALLCRWIRLLRPDVVLGHDPWRRHRLHPDHRHAGLLLTDAVVAARDPHFFPDQGLAPHRFSELLLFETDAPDHVEGVDGHLERKLAALLEHRSQLRSTFGISPDDLDAGRTRIAELLEEEAARQGMLAGLGRGEAFLRLDAG